MQTNKLIKSSMYLMIATVFSGFIGFFREIIIGNVLGTTNIADAYFVATSIPGIIFAGLAGAIGTTFIPMYVGQKEKQGRVKSLLFVNNVVNIVLLLSVFVAVISLIFAKPIISIIAIGFDEETLNISIGVARIVFMQIIAMGLIEIFKGYLNSNNHFITPALMVVPFSVFIIISLLFYNKIGIVGVAYATLFGTVAQLLLVLISSIFKGYRFKPILSFKENEVKTMLLLVVPVFIGSSISQCNAIIHRMLASGLEYGSIAALNYASKLNSFIYGIVSMIIFTIVYPLLSKLNANENKDAYKKLLAKSISIITMSLIPISVGICILREPLIKILFERGVFNTHSTFLTTSALFFYSLGLLFMGYVAILSRAFYSIHDTRSPTISSVISLCISIVLNILLVQYMQHNALALSNSISFFINAIILSCILRKKIGGFGGRTIIKTFCKSAVSSVAMGVLVFMLKEQFIKIFQNETVFLQLGFIAILITIGAIIYISMLLVFKTEELFWFIKSFRLKNMRKDKN